MDVELRGIYTTALTAVVRAADVGTVVNASPPIERRFETTFETAPPTVSVQQTRDRLGVGIHGPTEPVKRLERLFTELGRDTLSFTETAPRGAVYTAAVDATPGGGAIMTLPKDREGYLPYDEVEGYVDVGDEYRVQVVDPQPPWSDQAPGVSTTLRVPGSLVVLERGHEGPTAAGEGTATAELLRSMDLFDVAIPEPWGIRWRHAAEEAPLEAREEALAAAAATAREVEAGLASPAPPAEIVQPVQTCWVLFGRETRFTLDGQRATVTPTLDGHHRIKAVGEAAATAVDFAEAICDGSAVPDETLTAQFGPAEGDTVAIRHGKPHGTAYSLGTGTVTDRDGATVTIEREISSRGTYDALGTERVPGDRAVTRCVEGQWWYPTVYQGADGTAKGTYVNVATPLEVFPDRVQYTDLYIDVVRPPDDTPEIVDTDELAAAVEAGHLSKPLAKKARTVARSVEKAMA